MGFEVAYSDDPKWVRTSASEFLQSKPVLHNLILTLLQARIASHQEGRYWLVKEGMRFVGAALQSPVSLGLNITPMPAGAIDALVDRIADEGRHLPGVGGEAATTAHFAGCWTERRTCAATPSMGMRIYEVEKIHSPEMTSGRLRQAVAADRDMLTAWMRAFYDDVGDEHSDPARTVEARLSAGQFWFWEDGEPVSLTAASVPVTNVVRVQVAYTPPQVRRQGFGMACAGALSRQIRDSGYRCILFTDLGNPVSNSVFRKIGYRCVAEALRYNFT